MTRSRFSPPVVGQSYQRSGGILWTVRAVDEVSVAFECLGRVSVVSLMQWARCMAVAEKDKERCS